MIADGPIAGRATGEQHGTSPIAANPSSRWTNIGLAALIVVLLTPSAIWIARDHSVWPWDPAWYGQVATDVWFNATHSLRAWGSTMLFEMDMKPPGIVWIGQFFVPLRAIFGSLENALLLSIVLTQAALLWIIFKIGQAITGSRLASFAGVVFASGTQQFVQLSHQMLVEPLQAVSVAWVVFAAAKCRTWPAARTLVHLACALVLGAAAKITTPVYCLLFCVYIAAVLYRGSKPAFRFEWRQWPSRILICLLVPAFLATAVWYEINFAAAWRHARDSSSGGVALDYGFRASLGEKLIVWAHSFHQSFLSPLLGWACLAAILAGAIFFAGIARRRPGFGAMLALSAAQSALLLLVFASNVNVLPRFMYSLIAFLAVLFIGFCAAIPSRLAVATLLAVCALQWGAANRSAPAIPALSNADRSKFDELTRVVEATSLEASTNVVAIEEPWLNANSADFFSAKRRLATGVRSHYISLGYAAKSLPETMQRISSYRARYVITLDESHQTNPPNFLNLMSEQVLRELKTNSSFQPVPFSSSQGILIFERH